MITVCLLGASGSIGQQTIDVMLKNPLDFDLVSFSIGKRTRYVRGIVKRFSNINSICLQNRSSVRYYEKLYPNIHFYCGDEGLNEIIRNSGADMVVNALVGFVGLKPSITALENDKILCLANKEPQSVYM